MMHCYPVPDSVAFMTNDATAPPTTPTSTPTSTSSTTTGTKVVQSSFNSSTPSRSPKTSTQKRQHPQSPSRYYKTELCENYMKGLPCQYGKKCNYAHGHQELRLLKLKERHEAGMINANEYRTKPCMIFVATGSW